MSGNINIHGYLDTVNAPWGNLFYQLVWRNINCEDKKILDFGSGFGITADYLAKKNEVTAMEPNEEMLEHRFCSNEYHQLIGGMEELKKLPAQYFDVIICHNVLEYLENREELFNEFQRVLNQDGFLSIVKHNKAGKIMQKAVFEYNVNEALELIRHGNSISANFGTINEYEDHDLEQYSKGYFRIEKVYGVRTFFALQRNELKVDADWSSSMYQLESAVEGISAFRDIAFFHHVILKPAH